MKLIDLFAGIGGIRLGFEQAANICNVDIKCVFSSEWDKFACQTYQANFGEMPYGDITKVDCVPPHDILCAGFPCQAFSFAGKKLGFDDTRGTLFFEIAKILNDTKPLVVFLENVKGLLSHDKGNTFNIICNTLKDLGYYIKYNVLVAKDFGVPQNRRRIYIIGFFNEDMFNRFSFPSPISHITRVGDILEDNIDEKYFISERLWRSHQDRKERNKQNGKGFGYQMVSAESKYTATLSARYYKDGAEILVQIPNKNTPRKLTPRECARLQGFPDDFIIPVSNTQAYKQFGNSVSVPVVREIAKQIFLVKGVKDEI